MPDEGSAQGNGGVAERKAELRRRMRDARAAIAPNRREELARAVEEHLLRVDAVARAGTVLVFYSFGSEIPTQGLIERLSSMGKRVLLPFLDDERRMEAAALAPGEVAVASAYGPKEPPNRVGVHPGEVDVVIAPGLAFDRAGHRLGYGGGHYDRYLRRLRPRALRIGIAFSVQVVKEVPADWGDERVHMVVTEDGVLDSPPHVE
jgi:5-formyltetrahydrofolate cyclo-ligase